MLTSLRIGYIDKPKTIAMIDSYHWIIGIINSCNNRFQIECCQNLIELFKRMYTQEDGVVSLTESLNLNMATKDILLTI